jgi:hypothetical protein
MISFFHNWLQRRFAWAFRPASVNRSDETAAALTIDPFAEPVELKITDVFDLHSIPPKQVKAVVEEYLFQARARGFPVVRLIHGKGRGVQRELVRTILSRTPFVREYHDAPDASSWGATIAYLQTEPLISDSTNARLE